MKPVTILGISVILLRIAVGFIDGSPVLIIFGLWSLCILLELTGFIKADSKNLPNEEGSSAGGNPHSISGKFYIFKLIVMVLLTTFIVGMGMSCLKIFFQIHMEIKPGFSGLRALMTVMTTLLIWEGGGIPVLVRRKERKTGVRLNIFLGLAVFCVLAAGYIFKGRALLIDPSAGFLLCILLFIRNIGNLLFWISFLYDQQTTIEDDSSYPRIPG